MISFSTEVSSDQEVIRTDILEVFSVDAHSFGLFIPGDEIRAEGGFRVIVEDFIGKS